MACLLICCLLPLHGQVRQSGQVTLQNSGKQPLSGVQVRAMGAVPASSDVQGNFNLHFNKARPGQLLLLDEVYKEGYELVNEQALKQWTVSPSRPLPIVMCPKGTLAAAQEKYYEIGKQHNMQKYGQACKQLEEQLKLNQISAEQYNAELDRLSAAYLQTMQQLEAYAYAMACYNRDDLNQMAGNALALVEAGQVDEALALYQEAQLTKLYTGLDKRQQQEAKEMEAMLPSLRLNADICLFAGGEENLQKAQDIYEAIALSDTTNAAYAMEYATFLSDHRFMLKEAQPWLQLVIRHSTDSLQLAELYSGMGMTDTYLGKLTEARTYLAQAKTMYARLQKDSAYAHDAYFNMSYASYGINESRYWLVQNKAEEAAKALISHIDYAGHSVTAQPEKYCYYYAYCASELAGTILNLSITMRKKTEENLKGIIELGGVTLDMLNHASRKEQTKALQLKADTYQLLARACANFRQAARSEAYADSCQQIINQGNKLNPILFAMTQAQLLETQGINLMNKQDYQAAIQHFIHAYNAVKQNPYETKGLMQILYYLASLSPMMEADDALAYTAIAWEEQQRHPHILSGITAFDIYYKYALIHATQGKDLPTCEDAVLAMAAYAKANDTRREWITDKNLSDIVLPCTALYAINKHKSEKKKAVLNSMMSLLSLYPALKEGKVYQYVLNEMK